MSYAVRSPIARIGSFFVRKQIGASPALFHCRSRVPISQGISAERCSGAGALWPHSFQVEHNGPKPPLPTGRKRLLIQDREGDPQWLMKPYTLPSGLQSIILDGKVNLHRSRHSDALAVLSPPSESHVEFGAPKVEDMKKMSKATEGGEGEAPPLSSLYLHETKKPNATEGEIHGQILLAKQACVQGKVANTVLMDVITYKGATKVVDVLGPKGADRSEYTEQVKKMYKRLSATDCTVNPLAEMSDRQLIDAGAELNFGEKEVLPRRATTQEDSRAPTPTFLRAGAATAGLNCIGRYRGIGRMANCGKGFCDAYRFRSGIERGVREYCSIPSHSARIPFQEIMRRLSDDQLVKIFHGESIALSDGLVELVQSVIIEVLTLHRCERAHRALMIECGGVKVPNGMVFVEGSMRLTNHAKESMDLGCGMIEDMDGIIDFVDYIKERLIERGVLEATNQIQVSGGAPDRGLRADFTLFEKFCADCKTSASNAQEQKQGADLVHAIGEIIWRLVNYPLLKTRVGKVNFMLAVYDMQMKAKKEEVWGLRYYLDKNLKIPKYDNKDKNWYEHDKFVGYSVAEPGAGMNEKVVGDAIYNSLTPEWLESLAVGNPLVVWIAQEDVISRWPLMNRIMTERGTPNDYTKQHHLLRFYRNCYGHILRVPLSSICDMQLSTWATAFSEVYLKMLAHSSRDGMPEMYIIEDPLIKELERWGKFREALVAASGACALD